MAVLDVLDGDDEQGGVVPVVEHIFSNLGSLDFLETQILDLAASGRSPAMIANMIPGGLGVVEVAMKLDSALAKVTIDDEIVRRNLQLYRYEQLLSSLWFKANSSGEDKVVQNVLRIFEQQTALLALERESVRDLEVRLSEKQYAMFMGVLGGLLSSVRLIARPELGDAELQLWVVSQLDAARGVFGG